MASAPAPTAAEIIASPLSTYLRSENGALLYRHSIPELFGEYVLIWSVRENDFDALRTEKDAMIAASWRD